MYRHCLFCASDLGTNDVVERFPVGRRLAYDEARGRLCVVCRRCERWNLSPLDERWEAIEECERQFLGTRLRASTENIGLARLTEGLELVRIGRPQRPEFAAWRYGDQFGRRRRRHIVGATIAGGVGLGLLLGSAGTIGLSGGMLPIHLYNLTRAVVRGRTRIALDDGTLASLPTEIRLALEMAANEDAERTALEGELAQLERAWREAETIAAIADDLILPERVRDALRRLQ